MKPTRVVLTCLVVGVMIGSTTLALASPPNRVSTFSQEKLALIEENLVLCLTSESSGVRTSAALTVKLMKEAVPTYAFNRSIIPLMRIVNNEDFDETSRIVAALALHALQSDRGDYAIKWTGHFTEASRVKHMYGWLTYERTLQRLAER